MSYPRVFLILSLICFFVSAIGLPSWRVNLVALGLFFYALREI